MTDIIVENPADPIEQKQNELREISVATIAAAIKDRPPSISALLNNRAKTHGDFGNHAGCTQQLKDTVELWLAQAGKAPTDLSYEAREALDMILHKLGRIVAGDATFRDHWDDIAGYATLVANRL